MARNAIRRAVIGTAFFAALGIGAQATHAAVLYSGTFDPYSFQGSYTVKVDDDCLTTNGWKSNSGMPFDPGDNFCTFSLLSAVATVTGDYNGTLTFAPPAIGWPDLYGINVVNNALDSLDSGLIPFQLADPATPGESWWLQFTSGSLIPVVDCEFAGELPLAPQDGCEPAPILGKGVYLYHATGTGPAFLADTAAYTGIQEIPEPGALGLALGALASAWVVRRRAKTSA